MLTISDLPSVNATLNAISAVMLLIGYIMIRRRNIFWHRIFMITAFVTSMMFFTSYVVYHLHTGSKPFTGIGAIRSVYFSILISHTILAAFVPFLAIISLYRAARGRFSIHRKIARWTLPIWLYVSVTGVIIYWMLYRL